MIGSLDILDFTSDLCKVIFFFFLQKYWGASSVSLGLLFFSVNVLLLWCSVYYRGPLSSPVRTSPDSCKFLLFWCGLFSTQLHHLHELLGLCNMFDCALHLVSMMVLVDSNSPRETNESDGKVVTNRESCLQGAMFANGSIRLVLVLLLLLLFEISGQSRC